jgi:hypothetical protein
MTRAQPFSVNDSHAPDMVLQGVRKKRPERLLGFRDCETVQVDLCLDTKLAAAELAQDTALDTLAGEHQLFAACKFRVARFAVKALPKHREAIGTCKTRTGSRPSRFWRRGIVRERLNIPHSFAEELSIVLIGLLIHGISAETRQNSIVTRLLSAPAPWGPTT